MRQTAVMNGTMVVVTERTLYRDINIPPGTGTEILSNQLAATAERFDNTRCEGCIEAPTGAYSGKLPLDRLQTIVSSADPTNVIRLDESARAVPTAAMSGCCCAGLADALWPQHYLTVTMAPAGMALSVYFNSVDELRGAMSVLPKAAKVARSGAPTLAVAIQSARTRRLSLMPTGPLVMERETSSEETAALTARYSRRDSSVQAEEPKVVRRRKTSIQWADLSLAQRASRLSTRVSSRVWPTSRTSRTSRASRRDRPSFSDAASSNARESIAEEAEDRWSAGGGEDDADDDAPAPGVVRID